MPPRKGENTKKAAGNEKKAKIAADKKREADSKKEAEEAKQWEQGAKSSKKAEEAANKKAEAARKKAERDALLAEEEKSQRPSAKGAGAKSAQKKTRGPDIGSALGQLDAPSGKQDPALHASGIDNALDALSLTSNHTQHIERHPERRYKAAYAAYEARRLPELDEEMKGLRRNQKIEIVRKEFEKSEENPFNKAYVGHDATREEVQAVRDAEKRKVEGRLAHR